MQTFPRRDLQAQAMKFEGVCYDTGAWGGDLTGHLVVFEGVGEGWQIVSSHISSGEGYSKFDIGGHYDRRPDEIRDSELDHTDTYEWIGRLTKTEMEERYGW